MSDRNEYLLFVACSQDTWRAIDDDLKALQRLDRKLEHELKPEAHRIRQKLLEAKKQRSSNRKTVLVLRKRDGVQVLAPQIVATPVKDDEVEELHQRLTTITDEMISISNMRRLLANNLAHCSEDLTRMLHVRICEHKRRSQRSGEHHDK